MRGNDRTPGFLSYVRFTNGGRCESESDVQDEMTDSQNKMKGSQTHEHRLTVQVDVTEQAGRRGTETERHRDGRADSKQRERRDKQIQRDRWTCRQLDWMESFGGR